jgi:hypothetical protein
MWIGAASCSGTTREASGGKVAERILDSCGTGRMSQLFHIGPKAVE